MKKIIAIALILFGSGVWGQSEPVKNTNERFVLSLEAGPSITFLKTTIGQTERKIKIACSGILSLQYNLNKIFSIKAGLGYEKKGNKVVEEATITYRGSFNDNITVNSTYNYIVVPLLFKASWGNRARFFVNAGPYFGFLMSRNENVKSENDPSAIFEVPPISDYSRLDVGVCGGLGLTVPVKKSFLVSCELRDNFGFTPVYKNGSDPIRSINLLFGLGYIF